MRVILWKLVSWNIRRHWSISSQISQSQSCFSIITPNLIFNINLGYFFNDFVMIPLSSFFGGGIPPPGRGIVGKNQSTRSKPIVRISPTKELALIQAPLMVDCLLKQQIFSKLSKVLKKAKIILFFASNSQFGILSSSAKQL